MNRLNLSSLGDAPDPENEAAKASRLDADRLLFDLTAAQGAKDAERARAKAAFRPDTSGSWIVRSTRRFDWVSMLAGLGFTALVAYALVWWCGQ